MEEVVPLEERLRQMLTVVFNLDSPDKIRLSDSLIGDLGADSLDFVEIIHLAEQNFGVVIKADEIMRFGLEQPIDNVFVDGRLTEAGAALLAATYAEKKDRLVPGMSKVDLFRLLTVDDLAGLIRRKMETQVAPC
jgi:acyl carrier protein